MAPTTARSRSAAALLRRAAAAALGGCGGGSSQASAAVIARAFVPPSTRGLGAAGPRGGRRATNADSADSCARPMTHGAAPRARSGPTAARNGLQSRVRSLLDVACRESSSRGAQASRRLRPAAAASLCRSCTSRRAPPCVWRSAAEHGDHVRGFRCRAARCAARQAAPLRSRARRPAPRLAPAVPRRRRQRVRQAEEKSGGDHS